MSFVYLLIICLVVICLAFVNAVPADNIDENTIIGGSNAGAAPIIGEAGAGVGSTIDVSAIKAAQEEENPPAPPLPTLEEFKKKSIKQLREYLKERGLECKGCSEKADYVNLAFDNRETPVISNEKTEEKKSTFSDVPDGEKLDQSKIDELLATMKKNGFGNNRFFNADDLANLTPEEMAAKFNDPNYGKSKPSKSKKSSDKSKKSSSSSSKKDSSSSKKSESKSKPKPSKPVKKEQPRAQEQHDEEAIEL